MVTIFTRCGYHVAGVETPQDIYSVAIPIFENLTTEPEVEFVFTEALRQEFLKRGVLKLVPVHDADVVFRGRIIKLSAIDVAHNRFNQTVESRLFATVDIRCEDRRTGKILWQDNQLTFSRSYPHGKMGFEDYRARRSVLEYIAGQIAERVYDRFATRHK